MIFNAEPLSSRRNAEVLICFLCGLGVSALRTITNKIWISLNGYKFGELDQS